MNAHLAIAPLLVPFVAGVALLALPRLQFALERAAFHAGKDADKCKKFLEEVKSQATWFVTFRADAIKSKSWITGATYKTKKGEKLPEAKFVAAFAT